MLQKRLEKLATIKESFPEYEQKLKDIEAEVDTVSNSLPVHYKESMIRDLGNVR